MRVIGETRRMRIEHAAIWTADVERLRAVYGHYLRAGDRYENASTGFESYFLELDRGARLELMQMASIPASRDGPMAHATAHLAFALGSEAAAPDPDGKRVELTV